MLLFSGRISGIIIAGGYDVSHDESSSTDFLARDLGMKQPLPNLPQNIRGLSMVAHNGTILFCGGEHNSYKCLKLDRGTWKEHSTLNEKRVWHSAVTTQKATFIFGGEHSKTTYEYLPKDSTEWIMGRTEIPGGFGNGCAIAIKLGQEIWLIGGCDTEKRILSFNVKNHTFGVMPFQLNVGRWGHSCAFIPNTNKLMITGGYGNRGILDSTEIQDTEVGSISMAIPMNSKRYGHGMGVITINGEDKLVVYGGYDGTYLDNVELYNAQMEKWETTDFKLSKAKACFSFLTVKLGDILSNLN